MAQNRHTGQMGLRYALRMGTLSERTVALCVSGSIAAYKAVEVARLLVQAGATVLPVMTTSAVRFIGPITLSGVCGQSVATDMFDPAFAGEMHVSISERADIIALVPATADLLARLAEGRANDLVTALALSAKGPVLAAPAMHPRMWDHPATKKNVAEIERQQRITLVGPAHGPVASGETGLGRMEEPGAIVRAIERLVTAQDLAGVHVVVTAGPTVEELDPVRFLSNRSTGKMGFAVATRAAMRGARVTLVAGPVSLPTPFRVLRIDVCSAQEMQEALWQVLGPGLQGADALIMTAAVADYRAANVSEKKMKKAGGRVTLELLENPDVLAEIGAARKNGRPVLVGFALETENLVRHARGKLAAKKADFLVANEPAEALGGEFNRAIFVMPDREDALPMMTKDALADIVLDRVKDRLD